MKRGNGGLDFIVFIENAEWSKKWNKKEKDFPKTAKSLLVLQGLWSEAIT